MLHKATWDEYIDLATEMAKEGFDDVVVNSGDGKRSKLPAGEYQGTAIDRSTALNKAKAAATRVGKKFAVLVTESNGRTWYNLDPA